MSCILIQVSFIASSEKKILINIMAQNGLEVRDLLWF